MESSKMAHLTNSFSVYNKIAWFEIILFELLLFCLDAKK